MVGAIECFCKLEEKRIGLVQYLTNKDYLKTYSIADATGTKSVKKDLCNDFYWRKKYAEVLSKGVGYAIIILNTVIRIVVIRSINWVGCDDSST